MLSQINSAMLPYKYTVYTFVDTTHQTKRTLSTLNTLKNQKQTHAFSDEFTSISPKSFGYNHIHIMYVSIKKRN